MRSRQAEGGRWRARLQPAERRGRGRRMADRRKRDRTDGSGGGRPGAPAARRQVAAATRGARQRQRQRGVDRAAPDLARELAWPAGCGGTAISRSVGFGRRRRQQQSNNRAGETTTARKKVWIDADGRERGDAYAWWDGANGRGGGRRPTSKAAQPAWHERRARRGKQWLASA
ncbi:hypothetical protein Scep_016204 [Stephania cephalantha]|uniref:Uncharacterized protein n=1 Tax=Stephania cephalantha TaxID=152367 RepID=A0AAP0INX5_9MAGN